MNIEQRLLQAFNSTDRSEPSPDLWSRVLHSIEEDRQHRRRVIGTASAIVGSLAALVLVGALALSDGPTGLFVHRPTMEALEAIAMITLVAVLGPAIRRFGRGYAADLWPAGVDTPVALLRLLDVAYYLVFAGYILLTTEFEFVDHAAANTLPEQLGDASSRFGGLLLLMGILHATTLIVLPIVAIVDNSTRTSRKVPRWIMLLGILVAVQVLPMLPPLIGVGLNRL